MRTFIIAFVLVITFNSYSNSQDRKPIVEDPIGKPLSKKMEDFLLNKAWCAKGTGGHIYFKVSKMSGSIYSTIYKTYNKDGSLDNDLSGDRQFTMFDDDTFITTYHLTHGQINRIEMNTIMWFRQWFDIDYDNVTLIWTKVEVDLEQNGAFGKAKPIYNTENETYSLCQNKYIMELL